MTEIVATSPAGSPDALAALSAAVEPFGTAVASTAVALAGGRPLSAVRLTRPTQRVLGVDQDVPPGSVSGDAGLRQSAPGAESPTPIPAVPAGLPPSTAAILRAFGIQPVQADRHAEDPAEPTLPTVIESGDAATASGPGAAAGQSVGGDGASAPGAGRLATVPSSLADAPAHGTLHFGVPSVPTDAASAAPQSAGPAGPAASGPADDQFLTGQVVKAVSLAWRDGVGEAKIRLTPEHLGEVNVALKVERGQVVAQLQAETPAARAWIETHQEDLRQALAAQGLVLGRLVVTSDGERHASPDDPGARQRRPAPRARPGAEAPRFEVTA